MPLPDDRPNFDATAVLKRMSAGAPGTKRHQRRFGDALVCVRYRHDAATGERLTTVELVIERRPAGELKASAKSAADATHLVRIDYHEADLRQRVKEAGGLWDPKKKLWRVPAPAVRQLRIANRVVEEN